MTSQAYAALIMVVYFRNYERGSVPSAKELIGFTDKLANKLQIQINISRKTKYNTVKKLIRAELLDNIQFEGYNMISMSKKIKNYLDERLQIVI